MLLAPDLALGPRLGWLMLNTATFGFGCLAVRQLAPMHNMSNDINAW